MIHGLYFLPGWGMPPAVLDELMGACGRHHPPQLLALPRRGATLNDWLNQLDPQIAPDSVLCGWSLGGLVALALARRLGAKIKGVVLIGSTPRFVQASDWPHGVTAAHYTQFATGIEHDTARTLRQFLALQTLGEPTGRAMTQKLAPLLESPDVAQLMAGLQILGQTDLRADLPHISQPVLLIHGADDALIPADATRWLHHHLMRSVEHIVPHAGHALPVSQAGLVAHFINDFVRGLRG